MYQDLGMPFGAGIGEIQGLHTGCGRPFFASETVFAATPRLPVEAETALADPVLAEKLRARLAGCISEELGEAGANSPDERGVHTAALALRQVLNDLYTQQNGGLNDA